MGDIFCENVWDVCGVNFCKLLLVIGNKIDEYDYKFVIRFFSIYVGIGVLVVVLVIVLFDWFIGSLDWWKK